MNTSKKRTTLASTIDENSIVEEFDILEECAKSNTAYYYNNKWGSNYISQLKEYACIHNLPKENFIGVNSEEYDKYDEEQEITLSSSKTMIKTASTSTNQEQSFADKLKLAMSDPFKIDEKLNTNYMDKSNWEKVSAPTTLKDNPLMTNGIKSIRGGEDYNKNCNQILPQTTNTINNPEAIDTFAKNNIEDTGLRLAREKKEREEEKIKEKKEWETQKLKEMKYKNIVAKGTVFLTENMNPQSGLESSSNHFGIYKKIDIESLPEKTIGEKIAASNDERKKSIQRNTEKEIDWAKQNESRKLGISDLLAESLKKELGK